MLALVFIGLVVLANVVTAAYGIVFGLVAAGTFAAGLTFAVRDLLHESGGRWWVLGAVVVGAGLSAWLSSPALALASGAAFVVSELADFAAYAPMRRRNLALAMLVSNTVGAVVDSLLFLSLAGFPLSMWSTQTVIKIAVTLPIVFAVALALRTRAA